MLDANKVKLGIAPIAWTNDDLPELGGENTFEQCVSEMALAGYTGSEVGNKYPREPAALNRALALRGLTICNAWFSAHLTTRPLGETLDAFEKQLYFLYEVGARVIGAAEQGHSVQGRDVPVFDARPVFTEDEWRRLAEGLDEMGRRAAKKGMALTYHHHMGTGIQTAEEIDRLLGMVEPGLVSLLLDTGHLAFAGVDPAAALRKHAKRIRHVHLKDVRPAVLARVRAEGWSFLRAVREGVFTVPGDGAIDYEPIFRTLAEIGYAGWMVVEAEQDPAKANPLEYALKARRFIRERAGI